jgi:ribosome-binding factor A
MSNRTVRINELVRRELNEILRRRYQSESVALTITEVRVAPDLRDARVFVAVVGDDSVAQEKLRWLRQQAPAIRDEIGRRVVLKFLPRFEYRLDESIRRSQRVLQILDEIEQTEKAAPPPAAPAPGAGPPPSN